MIKNRFIDFKWVSFIELVRKRNQKRKTIDFDNILSKQHEDSSKKTSSWVANSTPEETNYFLQKRESLLKLKEQKEQDFLSLIFK